MARQLKHLLPEEKEEGHYFASPSSSLDFIHSGSALLDCVLGGGWALTRIVNIVGDKSTGKTLLAIEACANFVNQYPDGKIIYAETEAAFDIEYARALGLPVDSISFAENIFTVEDFFEHLEAVIDLQQSIPVLYVLDSLDALSDRAELGRAIDEGTFGASKPKKLSEIFRRLNQKVSRANICVMIVSQVRDNIGVSFGEKHTRSGGKALDFYASQVVWLSLKKTLLKTRKKVQRPIGLEIKAKCKKNKVGLPLRECIFPLMFGYGVDDVTANVSWLDSVDRLDGTYPDGLKENTPKYYLAYIEKLDEEEYIVEADKLSALVKEVWAEIETGFLPTRKKYR